MDKKSDYSSLTTEVIDLDMQTFMFEKFNDEEPEEDKEEKVSSKKKSKEPSKTMEIVKGLALGVGILATFIVADQLGFLSFWLKI